MLAWKWLFTCLVTLCLASVVLAAPNAVSAPAQAVPNLVGATGLLYTPSAEVTPNRDLNASLNSTNGAAGLEYAVNYGIYPSWEVGVTRLGEKETVVNAKYRIQTESAKGVGIAAGGMDLTDQVSTVLYVVASKGFDPDLYGVDNFHFNLGIAGGGKKMVDVLNKGEMPNSLALNGPFAGLNFDIAKCATAIAEFDGRNVNLGLRGTFYHHLTATFGFVGPSHKIAGGLSYTLKL
jgi:hypothetical protein